MSVLPLALLFVLGPVGDDKAPPEEGRAAPRRRVELTADFDQPRLVSGLWLALEAAVPLFERATAHALPPGETLVVHLYRTIEGYREATRAVGVSGFMEVGAVTAWSTHESYLALQPWAEPAYLAAAGWLPDLLLQLALHEAAHQFMTRAGMYPPMGLPPWYAEGVADHLAERVLRELFSGSGRRWLMLDDAEYQVAQAVDEGRALPLAELFGLDPESATGLADRTLFYDQSRAVVAFLETGARGRWSRTWRAWLAELDAADRPDQPFRLVAQRERQRERWLELAGNLQRLERDWWRDLPRPQPAWREVLGSTQWADEALLTSALAWQDHGYAVATSRAPRRPRRFACELDLLDLGGGEAYVVLHGPEGDDDAGLKLTLRNDGRLHVVGWRGKQSSRATFQTPALRRREGYVPVEVRIDGRQLVIQVDLDAPIEAEAPGGFPAPGGGAWGLGVWRDAALWRNVRYE